MASRGNLLIMALHASLVIVSQAGCPVGYTYNRITNCTDEDECELEDGTPTRICGPNANCSNTVGSFYCRCVDGFQPLPASSPPNKTFTPGKTCYDINECQDNICGPNANCNNTSPGYFCSCDDGFISSNGMETFKTGDHVTCDDINECEETDLCKENEACVNTKGKHVCICKTGFRLRSGKCEELRCDVYTAEKKHPGAKGVLSVMETICLKLNESKTLHPTEMDDLLQTLLSMIDGFLSSVVFNNNRDVSTFLDLVENALRLVGPFISTPGTKRCNVHTELELLVHRDDVLPRGNATLSSEHARLDIQWQTAAGEASLYPDFATVTLLSYKNLEKSTDGFFTGMTQPNDRIEINSKVVTATVSNRDTKHLKEPVILTFYHLQPEEGNHTCVYWDSTVDGGIWSTQGCSAVTSNSHYTVCSCDHLSSFAVLMARHDMKDVFALDLITWIGLFLSLVCLFLCMLTFSRVRSIQSPRTTIHLHLCISLFIANFVFLVGISRTENPVGCAVVAGLLHYFYLAAFCWMCLEGIQLYRMVVLVFNTTFKTLAMMAGGYGVPAVIVAISVIANAKGYGTEKHCWLNLEGYFIWSFYGPACVIIAVNIIFFLITVWKLAEKFSSLNPDLNNLRKIKTFIITAVAQMCVLGTMWIFGCFMFEGGSDFPTYMFTIFGSLQGVLLFTMHCLLSKQVRDEYRNFLSRVCAPLKKKKYSEFSSSQSSKAAASKSSQNTGESHVLEVKQ